ncbi:MAG: bifunctional lysylphosphatidylglycerol synthetase/lysine--tRNA ligase LysX [Mycobacteriales bacterium]
MTEPPEDVPEQIRVRRDKYLRLRAAGVDPYPVGYPRTATAAELRAAYADLPVDTSTGRVVGVAGRVVLYRIGGGLCFATLRDGSGEIQVMVSRERTGEEGLAGWKADVDLGDHVGVTGEVITSRRGELSVLASSFAITSKALRPLPDKFHGLADPEARVRQRYVDLIVRPEARQLLELRSAVVWGLRAALRDRGYLEVETPMLQRVHGGAAARPFVTHMSALDLDLYLRIAPELYLKRVVVGGVEKVFEINRVFRNEGMDSSHNPEFTMLEAYEAYGDYDTMAELTRALVVGAAGAARAAGFDPPVDLSGEWRSVTVHDAVSAALGEPVSAGTDRAELVRLAERAGVALRPEWGPGAVLLELYEKLVEPTLVAPTFVRDFPVEVSPLTRGHRADPRLAERWDLVVLGRELGTAYSELVDPVEQRRRLTEQSLLAAAGDPDAMALDEDFLRALEVGMPPSGGMGMGIDRLLMVVAGVTSVRETTLFPLVRPE